MKEVTPKNFRSELKNYLELADKEPIKICRRSGKKYILVTDSKFLNLKNELSILREKIKDLDPTFVYEKLESIQKGTKKLTKISKKVLKNKPVKKAKKKVKTKAKAKKEKSKKKSK